MDFFVFITCLIDNLLGESLIWLKYAFMIYEVLMNMLALHFDNNEVSFTPYQHIALQTYAVLHKFCFKNLKFNTHQATSIANFFCKTTAFSAYALR